MIDLKGWTREEYEEARAVFFALKPTAAETRALVEELQQYTESTVPLATYLRRRIAELRRPAP